MPSALHERCASWSVDLAASSAAGSGGWTIPALHAKRQTAAPVRKCAAALRRVPNVTPHTGHVAEATAAKLAEA